MSQEPEFPGDSPYESGREVIPIVERLKELKSFWKTRSAVLSGEILSDLTKDQLRQRELMGPWKFNIVQSTISSLPGVCIAVWTFMTKRPRAPIFATLPEFEAVNDVLAPFVIPFALLLTAWAIGRTITSEALPSSSSLGATRERLARKYLYLDAAHGLFPQTIAAMYLNLSESMQFAQLLMVWQLVITLRVIPSELYAGGESFDKPLQLFKTEAIKQVPWKSYLVTVLIMIPMLTIALGVVVIVLALGVSALIHWLRAR